VRSPIDGIVLAREVEVGQTVVAAFQTPVLFLIAEDLRVMRASVDVDEADVGQVREGAAATFTVAAYLGRTFDARVVTVHNAARLVDRVVTYEAELAVDNPDLALRPGMTVTAAIVAREVPDALLVPAQALRFTPPGEDADEGDHVWILRDGRPVAVAVTVEGDDDILAAVTAPELAPGTLVIVNTR
jgi:HlyD family secretion protein